MATVSDAAPNAAPGARKSGGGRAPKRKRSLSALRGIYPQSVSGALRRTKWVALIGATGFYYLAPWFRWDRGPGEPGQMILVDVGGGRIYLADLILWPQDLYLATGLLILAALGLFMATALYGRLWCGFACPQTVWTDIFMWVERWIEGDRTARMRLDAGKNQPGRMQKKLAKHLIWIAISMLTGGAFVLYFRDAPTLMREFATGSAPAAAHGFLLVLTATTYLLAGWAREKVCTHMCPWPRFQAALLDKDSLVVTYQEWRGEPRGKVKQELRPSLRALEKSGAQTRSGLIELARAAADGVADGVASGETGRGDCIDCNQCVVVCPMGIDIRKGFQLECIGCGLCVDACGAIMDKVGRPRGLIAFDSERNHAERSPGDGKTGTHRFRARTIVYAILMGLVIALLLAGVAGRDRIEVSVMPDRSPVFVRLSDGGIRNTYTLRLTNKLQSEQTFTIAMRGFDGLTMRLAGRETPVSDTSVEVSVDAGEVGTMTVFVTAPRALGVTERNDVEFVFETVSGEETITVNEPTYFWGPDK